MQKEDLVLNRGLSSSIGLRLCKNLMSMDCIISRIGVSIVSLFFFFLVLFLSSMLFIIEIMFLLPQNLENGGGCLMCWCKFNFELFINWCLKIEIRG